MVAAFASSIYRMQILVDLAAQLERGLDVPGGAHGRRPAARNEIRRLAPRGVAHHGLDDFTGQCVRARAKVQFGPEVDVEQHILFHVRGHGLRHHNADGVQALIAPVYGGCQKVIGTDAAQCDGCFETELFRVRQQKLQLAHLVAAVHGTGEVVALDEQPPDAEQIGKGRAFINRGREVADPHPRNPVPQLRKFIEKNRLRPRRDCHYVLPPRHIHSDRRAAITLYPLAMECDK